MYAKRKLIQKNKNFNKTDFFYFDAKIALIKQK